jgi:hypothetical protein
MDKVISQGRNSWEIIDINVGLYYELLVHIKIFEIKILSVVNVNLLHPGGGRGKVNRDR